MSSNADDLRDLFVEVTDEETVVEERAETPSHDPIEDDDEFLASATEDGLEDAVEGTELGGDGPIAGD